MKLPASHSAATDHKLSFRSSVRRLVLLTILSLNILMLSSCSIQPGREISSDIPESPAAALSSWYSSGKIALRNGSESTTLRFEWTQINEQFEIYLSGNLGIGSMTLVGDNSGVKLWKGKRGPAARQRVSAHASARSAEHLLLRQTGWRLPVSLLRYWTRGLPAPQLPSSPAAAQTSRIPAFQQAGWQVIYPTHAIADNYLLPKKLRASNDQLLCIMAFQHWRVIDGPPAKAPALSGT